jgi:hypothetical protein
MASRQVGDELPTPGGVPDLILSPDENTGALLSLAPFPRIRQIADLQAPPLKSLANIRSAHERPLQ